MHDNVNKDISVLEMGLKKGAGRAFETAMKAFMVDQMLDRDIVEQFFGFGSLSRVLPKALRKIEGRRRASLGAIFRQIKFSRASLSGLYLGRRGVRRRASLRFLLQAALVTRRFYDELRFENLS